MLGIFRSLLLLSRAFLAAFLLVNQTIILLELFIDESIR